ncbi:MAG: apolipoprotein N-acyltransferase [Gammaproteobacteria bacterium]
MSAAPGHVGRTVDCTIVRLLRSCDKRVRHRILGDLLALACGAITVLAFAPFNLYPLAILTLTTLFWLLNGTSVRRAFWRGFLFGVAEFSFGLYWLYISIHIVSGAPAWLTLLVIAAIVIAMAVYSGLACGLGVWFTPRAGMLRWVLLLPALWVLLEWLRGWLLSGFPWLSLGYSQIGSVLKGYAPVLGVYGVSFAVVLSAGLLLSTLTLHAHWRSRFISIALLVAVWVTGAVLLMIPWTRPSGAPIKVSLIQGNIPQSLKWDPQSFLLTLQRYHDLTAAHWDSRLIIWPESAIPDYADDVQQDYLDPLEAEARKHGTDMLIGILTENQTTGAAYNSVISLGGHDGVYNKRHLVPMAEYFPAPAWVTRWLQSMNLPYSSFTPGAARQPLLQVAGYSVDTSICYEDAFGSEIMRGLPQAAFLVNVSNDAWFGDSIALPQHFEISRMRALEAGRFLLRDTNTGITAVVNPAGEIVKKLDVDTAGVLTTDVPPYLGSTPYVRVGNIVIVLLCVVLILITVWLGRLREIEPVR